MMPQETVNILRELRWAYEPCGDAEPGPSVWTDHFVMEGRREIACPPDEGRAKLMAAAPRLYRLLAYGRAAAEHVADFLPAGDADKADELLRWAAEAAGLLGEIGETVKRLPEVDGLGGQ